MSCRHLRKRKGGGSKRCLGGEGLGDRRSILPRHTDYATSLGGCVDLEVRPAGVRLDGQSQRVDVPFHARTAHHGLQQRKLEEDLC